MKDSNNSIKAKQPSTKGSSTLMYINLVLLLLVFIAVSSFFLSSWNDTPSKHIYAPIVEIDPRSLTNEERARDVVDWTKDVADYMRPSKKRELFGSGVAAATKDGEIDADEYSEIKNSYRELKSSAHIEEINHNLMKIKGVYTLPYAYQHPPMPTNGNDAPTTPEDSDNPTDAPNAQQ